MLRAGESTGYGRRFVATESTAIGIVPVGYADGIRRDMTGTRVEVEGRPSGRPGGILIPRDETMEDDIAAEKVAASFSLVPEHANYRQITYRVRRGDTIYSVARRWSVKTDEIVARNNLRGDQLFAGQRILLTVAKAPAKKPAAGHKTTTVRTAATSSKQRSLAAAQARQ